jgi:hypothetical protein
MAVTAQPEILHGGPVKNGNQCFKYSVGNDKDGRFGRRLFATSQHKAAHSFRDGTELSLLDRNLQCANWLFYAALFWLGLRARNIARVHA